MSVPQTSPGQSTVQVPVVEPTTPAPAPMSTEPPDPFAQITLTPRAFFGAGAILAMLLGLVFAIVPVHVATPDPASNSSVTCGNTLGGVETDIVAGGLGTADKALVVSYVDMCERGVSERATTATLLFFGGAVVGLWLGVVRRRDSLFAEVTRPAVG